MSAVLIAPHLQAVKGQLGTTFGGNHLACTAALAVLDVIEEEHLIDNAATVGRYLKEQLQALAATTPAITEVRGEGLMIGIEFAHDIKEMRRRLVEEQHVFTGVASTNILRLLPPLCLTQAEADDFLIRLRAVL
jgi:acetylornithine aminotransferase